MDMRCRITSGEGNLRDSATEIKPPASFFSLPRLRGRVREGAGKGETVR